MLVWILQRRIRRPSTRSAPVSVPARRPEHAREFLAEAGAPAELVDVELLNLADRDSVKAFAARFLGSGRPLDILINNAAVMSAPETRVGPGWESQFATNHLGHFTLANLLWPALAAGGVARVVALSCTGHKLSAIRFDDPQFSTGYDKWKAYGQAKTANSLFAVQLDRLARGSGGPGICRASGRDHDRAAASSPHGGDDGCGLDRCKGQCKSPVQIPGAGRSHRNVGGDVPAAGGKGWSLLRGLRYCRADGPGLAGGQIRRCGSARS